jgi:hypothetical protein
VLYKFEHGFSLKRMLHKFDVGASIIYNYVNIICNVLYDIDKLIDKYINTSFKQWLLGIIHQF